MEPDLILRERLLAAFLEDSSNRLAAHDETGVRLLLSSGALAVLMAAPPDPAELRRRVVDLVANHKSGTLHIVVVGGGPEAAEQLRQVTPPRWKMGRVYGCHQLGLDGTLQRIAGVASPELGKAMASLPNVSPVPPERLAALLEQGRGQVADEVRLAEALRARFPWVTLTIGVVCVAMFVLQKIWEGGSEDWAVISMGANNGASVKNGEVWRLLSSAFLHANIQHLLFNMMALAGFGPLLERIVGAPRYIALYVLSALGGGLASAFLRAPGFSVGASGAIWGLMTAGVALSLRPRGLLPPHTLAKARKQGMVPLAINLFYSFTPGIDIHAHLGGGVVGAALVLSGLLTAGVQPLWAEGHAREERRSPGWTLLAAVLGLAMISSVGAALATGRPWAYASSLVPRTVTLGKTGLSIDVPDVIAGQVSTGSHDGFETFEIGNLGRVPILVEVITKAIPAEDVPPSLEGDRRAAEKQEDEKGYNRRGPPRIVTVNGHELVAVTHDVYATLTRHTWLGYLGPRVVLVRVYTPRTPPAAWKGLEDDVIASLEAAP